MSKQTKRIIIGCKKGFTGVQSLVKKSKFDASLVQMINQLNVCVYNVSKIKSKTSLSQIIRDAILYARQNIVVVVADAGNDNTNTQNYPAAYKYVISIAATNRNDRKASFSNFGASWVDVAAPGVNILSTCPNHNNKTGCVNYGSFSGTSMSDTSLVNSLH